MLRLQAETLTGLNIPVHDNSLIVEFSKVLYIGIILFTYGVDKFLVFRICAVRLTLWLFPEIVIMVIVIVLLDDIQGKACLKKSALQHQDF